MALTTGTKLDPYQILTPLCSCGMGEVYCARDTRRGGAIVRKAPILMLRSTTTTVVKISMLLLVALVPASSAQGDAELQRQARNLTGAVFAGSSMDNLRELCD